jgi:hypothetical protein
VSEVTDELVDRVIRRQGWLDPLAAVVQRAVGKGYAILGAPGAALRSAMHGTRIAGHALHPALTDLPVGAWIAGVVFDFVAHFTSRIPTEAGDIALAIGLVGALGSAATGYTDFFDTLAQTSVHRPTSVYGPVELAIVIHGPKENTAPRERSGRVPALRRPRHAPVGWIASVACHWNSLRDAKRPRHDLRYLAVIHSNAVSSVFMKPWPLQLRERPANQRGVSSKVAFPATDPKRQRSSSDEPTLSPG